MFFDLTLIMRRKKCVNLITFNVNHFTELDCLKLFRFKKREISRVSECTNFHGRTARRGYVCDTLTAACIMLRTLSYPSRWYDLEKLLGIQSSMLSEIFWEVTLEFFKNNRHLVTPFRSELMRRRAGLYSQHI